MASFMSARGIAIEALRKIGAFTRADTGPDGYDLDVAITGLDIVLAHKLSTDWFWFLTADVYSITLDGGTASYDLMTELGSSWPSDGLIFPITVYINDGSDNLELEMVRRDEWDALDKDETGNPCKVYFDRSDPNTITMRTWPTLGSGVTGWSVKLTAQQFSKDFTAPLANPTVATKLSPAWNMWAIYELSCYLGDGTVRRLSRGDLDRYQETADKLFMDLKGFANQEHADDYICEPWGDE